MRYKLFLLLLFFICVANVLSAAEDIELTPLNNSAEDLYWISFSGDDDADAVFIMQINAKGKVTIAPKKVLEAGRLGGERGATAIGQRGARKLNLWVWGEDEILYRATIHKDGLRVLNVKKVTAVEVDDNDALQVTQKQNGNFLLAETNTGDLHLYPLNSLGLPTGVAIDLVSNAPRSNDEATISPDGLVVLTIRQNLNDPTPSKDNLYAVQLDSTGKALSAKKIAVVEDIEAADVTNPLPNGTRFAVFVVDNPDHQVVLQVLGPTNAKSGPPLMINATHGREVDEQNIAIDPLGRFVIFTVSGDNFGCPDQDVLVFQRLSASGAATGKLKAIAKCGLVDTSISYIDLVKE